MDVYFWVYKSKEKNYFPNVLSSERLWSYIPFALQAVILLQLITNVLWTLKMKHHWNHDEDELQNMKGLLLISIHTAGKLNGKVIIQ